MIFETFLVLLIVWYIVFHIKRMHLYKLASKFEGPSTLPIIGNALKCMIPVAEMPSTLLKAAKGYKSSTRFWFGPKLVIYVSNPEDLKTVLTSPHALSKQPQMYQLGEKVTGRGVLTLPIQEWKRHRKLISPTFSPRNLEIYFAIYKEYTKNFVSEWQKKIGKGVFDVEDDFIKFTLSTIFESLLGYKLNEGGSTTCKRISSLLKTLLVELPVRLSNFLYYPDAIYNRTGRGKKFAKSLTEYEDLIHSVVEKWQKALVNENIGKDGSTNREVTSTPKNFVEHLLLTSDEMGKLTVEDLQGEVKNVIVAGLEASASSLAFLMLILGMHEDIQNAIYQEITDVLGPEKELQFKDLKSFPYLERVIKENLRLFPAVAVTGRYTDQEIKLNEHQTIPANTSIAIGILTLHRDPSIWPNPTKFDPDRFLPEEEAKRHPYSWIPFSAGPRNCIGFQLAMQTLKILTIALVSNFHIKTPLKTVDDIQLSGLFGPRSAVGYKISVTAR